MVEENITLEFDKPHFTVRLYADMLKVDLKGTFKNEVEEVLENKPILKQTFGAFLGIFVPLHIRLSDIDSANVNEAGKARINISHHREIVIPLERKESEKLVSKLNTLIPAAKKKELRRIMEEHKLEKIDEERREIAKEEQFPMGGATFPMPLPPGMREKQREAEKEMEEETEKED